MLFKFKLKNLNNLIMRSTGRNFRCKEIGLLFRKGGARKRCPASLLCDRKCLNKLFRMLYFSTINNALLKVYVSKHCQLATIFGSFKLQKFYRFIRHINAHGRHCKKCRGRKKPHEVSLWGTSFNFRMFHCVYIYIMYLVYSQTTIATALLSPQQTAKLVVIKNFYGECAQ